MCVCVCVYTCVFWAYVTCTVCIHPYAIHPYAKTDGSHVSMYIMICLCDRGKQENYWQRKQKCFILFVTTQSQIHVHVNTRCTHVPSASHVTCTCMWCTQHIAAVFIYVSGLSYGIVNEHLLYTYMYMFVLYGLHTQSSVVWAVNSTTRYLLAHTYDVCTCTQRFSSRRSCI